METRAQVSPFLGEGPISSRLKWGARNLSLLSGPLSLALSTDHLKLPAFPSVLHQALGTLCPPLSAQGMSVPGGVIPFGGKAFKRQSLRYSARQSPGYLVTQCLHTALYPVIP